MIVHRAAWVLPIASRPIRNGWVAVEDGRIVAVGGPSDAVPAPVEPAEPPEHRAPVAILPGLVNAHVHLELSWLRGAIPPASRMPAWASSLIARRRAVTSDPEGPVHEAIREARAFGTALVGDVTNTLATYEPLAKSPLSAVVFYEQLGFKADEPEMQAEAAQARLEALPAHARVRGSVVPHAPYSVSPALLRAIGAVADARVMSIHLAESVEEVQFLADGTGAWRELLEHLGVWNGSWTCPRCGPVEYIARAGLLNERLLAVHGVQLTDAELARLTAADATLVCCPRSNVWTGAGTPPVERFYAAGLRIAVGTDSLASADDLNVFSELVAMRSAASGVPASRLLHSATQAGAEALGFGADLGTIEQGKRAELLAVRLPGGVDDVEEYLVGGVGAADVKWLES